MLVSGFFFAVSVNKFGAEKFRIAADGTTSIKGGDLIVENGEYYLHIDVSQNARIGDMDDAYDGNYLDINWTNSELTYYGTDAINVFSIDGTQQSLSKR